MGQKPVVFPGFETRAIHAGASPDPATGSRQTPIYQTASFSFCDSEHAAALFNLDQPGYVYSRLTNPTVSILEKRVADLEGGVGATATSSGIAAHLVTFFAFMQPGDEFLFSKRLYGGTYNQFKESFQRFGWIGHAVDPDEPENFRRALTPKCKAIFVEMVSNPSGIVVDIEAVANITHEAGIPLIVDNTIPTPALCQPFEWGADIVTHSLTKYLSGNGSSMGGMVVDSGQFDWAQNNKFSYLAKAEPSYNQRNFSEAFGNQALTVATHAVGLRDLGPSLAPMNAYLILNSIETLPLRMERHSTNALKVAEFLQQHPNISHVSYPGLADSPYYPLVKKYLPHGASSVFTFCVKGGYEAGKKVVGNVQLFSHVANIGDTRSLMIHPASTTHHQLTPEALAAVGIEPGTIRVSIGLETVDDIIADLEQALSI